MEIEKDFELTHLKLGVGYTGKKNSDSGDNFLFGAHKYMEQ